MGRQTVFSRRLRQARKRLGISQLELGVRIGLDPGVASTRLNRYEQAVHLPDYFTLERLADALGVPLAYLFAHDEELANLILTYRGTSDNSSG
jgi:transcriptional regulator with XRE-family HTH domain